MRGIIRRATINKRTKQLSVTIPKKEFKKIYPTIKFAKNLCVELKAYWKRGIK